MRKYSILLLSIALFVGGQAWAAGLIPCGEPGNPCDLCDVFGLGVNILNFFLIPTTTNNGFAIVPTIATLLIAWGGFTFLTAGGNTQSLDKGKRILAAVVIGLVIVYASWLFVNFLFSALGVADWVGVSGFGQGTGPWQIQCGI